MVQEMQMIQTVPVQNLTLAPENPRKEVQPEALAELAESIREQGVLQNLLAYADEEGLRVVGGGRRLRALERLLAEGAIGPEYPVPVRVLPKEEALAAALVENLQRQDMSPAEEIEAVARLVERVGLAEAARRTGKSPGYLKLRHQVYHHLDPQAQEWLLEGMLSWAQAEALVRVSPEVQRAFLDGYGNHWQPSTLFLFLDRTLHDPLFTLEEYTAAGGALVYDLEGRAHLGDVRLAQELQVGKLAKLAEEVGLPWVDRAGMEDTYPVYRKPTPENLRESIETLQRIGYAVRGLTWRRGEPALVVERRVGSTSQTEAAPPRPALSAPAKARFQLAAEVSQAHRFAQGGDLRRAMALFVLELADRYTYRHDRWRWSPGEYGLLPNDVSEGWQPLFQRLREIVGEPSLDSLAANPRLEEAFCLAAGMGLGVAQKPVALLGLTSEKTLKGLPTAYLNRVLEAHGGKAAKTKKEALARLRALPPETELDLEEAEKIESDGQD